MKAKRYHVRVYESPLDVSHDFGHIIEEVFIPDLEICFNSEGHVFKQESARDKEIQDVEVDDYIANTLAAFIERKSTVENWITSFFSDEKTEDYVPVDLDLSNDVMLDLALKAHEKELTLSEFINHTFEEYIRKYEDIEEPREVRSFNTTAECHTDDSSRC